MEKIHGNMHVFVLSCELLTSKHKNMRVSMYFLYLVLNFTPHYIITDKGLLSLVMSDIQANIIMHTHLRVLVVVLHLL